MIIETERLRKGYAFEAARASIDYAFNTLGWPACNDYLQLP